MCIRGLFILEIKSIHLNTEVQKNKFSSKSCFVVYTVPNSAFDLLKIYIYGNIVNIKQAQTQNIIKELVRITICCVY